MTAPAYPDEAFAARGERWAVATPHPLAAEAAEAAFAAGGNAVDAALHAAVTMAVVSPQRCGVGGDLFALVQNPDGKLVAIDSSGRAPASADADALRATHGTRMPETGPDTITVPGAIRGWEALHRQGAVLPWRRAFDAAAGVADGFPVSRDLAWSLARGGRHPARGRGDRRRLLRARPPDRRRHARATGAGAHPPRARGRGARRLLRG